MPVSPVLMKIDGSRPIPSLADRIIDLEMYIQQLEEAWKCWEKD